MSSLITELQTYYQDFLRADTEALTRFYDKSLVFRDPLHELHGLDTVTHYFTQMREGLKRCEFEFDATTLGDGSACLPWQMHYAHPALNGGRDLTLRGCSLVRFKDRIDYHEDFYDLGAMTYERVPLLGALVRGVKSRLAKLPPEA